MRRGFTLIELVVAMAILAVISVMAVQALGGVLHQRSVLTRVDERDAGLIRALSLLRQDLEAAVPMAAGDALAGGIRIEADGYSWWRAGFAEVPGGLTGLVGGVRWALADGTLSRRVIRPVGDSAPLFWGEPVLQGVAGLTLLPLGLADAGDGPALAPGFEVMLTTEAWGPLRLVVAR